MNGGFNARRTTFVLQYVPFFAGTFLRYWRSGLFGTATLLVLPTNDDCRAHRQFETDSAYDTVTFSSRS